MANKPGYLEFNIDRLYKDHLEYSLLSINTGNEYRVVFGVHPKGESLLDIPQNKITKYDVIYINGENNVIRPRHVQSSTGTSKNNTKTLREMMKLPDDVEVVKHELPEVVSAVALVITENGLLVCFGTKINSLDDLGYYEYALFYLFQYNGKCTVIKPNNSIIILGSELSWDNINTVISDYNEEAQHDEETQMQGIAKALCLDHKNNKELDDETIRLTTELIRHNAVVFKCHRGEIPAYIQSMIDINEYRVIDVSDNIDNGCNTVVELATLNEKIEDGIKALGTCVKLKQMGNTVYDFTIEYNGLTYVPLPKGNMYWARAHINGDKSVLFNGNIEQLSPTDIEYIVVYRAGMAYFFDVVTKSETGEYLHYTLYTFLNSEAVSAFFNAEVVMNPIMDWHATINDFFVDAEGVMKYTDKLIDDFYKWRNT